MMLPRAFMRVFFYLLYHPFAFAYDWVAALVSFGQWKNWVAAILPYVEGTRVLELGHGPGHLQRALRQRGLDSYGLDESPQMGRLAARRLGEARLIRGLAQALPFPPESFDAVLSTFPTEYIFDPRALTEIRRVLRAGGRLIVLPIVFPTHRLLKWLYQVTGESPFELGEALKEKLKQPFLAAGFDAQLQTIEARRGVLLMVLAQKVDS